MKVKRIEWSLNGWLVHVPDRPLANFVMRKLGALRVQRSTPAQQALYQMFCYPRAKRKP